MGCLFSLPETNQILDEIVYTHGVDFYVQDGSDEYEVNSLFFLYD
jgi:hypothetical protein